MNKSMMIIDDGNTAHLFTCAYRDCKNKESDDQPITSYYSYKHAYEKGWRFSCDPLFSENGQEVGLCPQCLN